MFRSCWRRLGLWSTGSHPPRRAKGRKPAPRFRPLLEVLEDRWVPATVTTLSDAVGHVGVSLRDAIAATQAGGTVDFQPGLNGTITLQQGQLTIAKALTIAGPGAKNLTVSAGGGVRVFFI